MTGQEEAKTEDKTILSNDSWISRTLLTCQTFFMGTATSRSPNVIKKAPPHHHDEIHNNNQEKEESEQSTKIRDAANGTFKDEKVVAASSFMSQQEEKEDLHHDDNDDDEESSPEDRVEESFEDWWEDEDIDEGDKVDESASEGPLPKNDPLTAYVRHWKVGLREIQLIEEKIRHEALQEEQGIDGDDEDDILLERAETETKKRSHNNYNTSRKVVILRNKKGLETFCDSLRRAAEASAAQWSGDANACAIGLDVEYGSLELDIRNTLPAMLQLSAPNSNGPVGLLWLDKFPNVGRDILTDDAYAPLQSLLADPAILKVGVGASKDAQHFAAWCGIEDRDCIGYFFSGIVDIEEEVDERVQRKNLVIMCEQVLQRHLPKIKQKRRKMKGTKERKVGDTAHWRADELTDQMKKYAVNDVACGVDVWMAVHGFRAEANGNDKF
jgi:hypothetical protein